MEIKELSIEQSNDNVCIYGASIGGMVLYEVLKKEGIIPKKFYDRNRKTEDWCGLAVEDIEKSNPENDIVVISQARSFQSACLSLEMRGFRCVYKCVGILERNFSKCEWIKCGNEMAIESFYRNYPLYADGFYHENKITLPVLEVFITECCTLKCRDCSHLIPYYDHPHMYSIDEIIDVLDTLLKVVDEVQEVTLLGGEPLLHPNINQLVLWCGQQRKIRTIQIITNGTILPTGQLLDSLAISHGGIRISDYGSISSKAQACKEMCDNRGVTCMILKEQWLDMGDIYFHSYDKHKLLGIYKDCPFSLGFLIVGKRLFRCAHIAHMNNLQYIKTEENDSVLIDREQIETGNLRNNLERLLMIEYMEGCRWCNGPDMKRFISPAIQCNNDNQKRRITID